MLSQRRIDRRTSREIIRLVVTINTFHLIATLILLVSVFSLIISFVGE